MANNCYLILGTPRSGTSLLASILQGFGIYMGNRFLPANEMNPKGFFQDIDFEEIFDFILTEYMPSDSFDLPLDRQIKLQQLIRERENLGIDWGFKISKTAHILHHIRDYCQSPIKLLITQRTTTHSIESINKWLMPNDQSGDEIITRAKNLIDRVATNSSQPIHTVNYDKLIDNPIDELKQIADYLNRPYVTGFESIVDKSLRHHYGY